MSTRTLGRLVSRLERSAASAKGSARPDAAWACMRRIMKCPDAHRAAIRAGEWVALNVPLGADVRDYPEAVRLMEDVEAALDAAAAHSTNLRA